MTWDTIARLVIEVGIPATAAIIENWTKDTPVTSEEFAKVRAVGNQTATDRMREQLVKAGIPLDSPEAERLLALTA